MRRTAELAKDFAERHGVPKWYDNVDALLADPEVNCVYIATPPGAHLEIARKVAAAGKPVGGTEPSQPSMRGRSPSLLMPVVAGPQLIRLLTSMPMIRITGIAIHTGRHMLRNL